MKEDRDFVDALARGLQVLGAFGPQATALTLSQIVQITGLPKATVSRLTYTLTELGFMKHSTDRRAYTLGAAVLALAYPVLASLTLRQVAQPFMREFSDKEGVNVSLSMLDRDRLVYVETCRAPSMPMEHRPDIGVIWPLTDGAVGRAFLVGLPQEERASVMNVLRVRNPARWPLIAERIRSGLEDYARDGFCTALAEARPGYYGVAVPVREAVDGNRFAFNCALVASSSGEQRMRTELGPRLVQMVASVEASMGFTHRTESINTVRRISTAMRRDKR